jgi:molybdate transport system regulatory protein
MKPMKLRSRLWIVDEEDRIIMGEGRMKILECIELTGSLNQTAKMMKMSYKGVWGKIRATEKYLNLPLVDTDRKEGTRLTGEGKELLEKYRLLRERCFLEEEKLFKSLFK